MAAAKPAKKTTTKPAAKSTPAKRAMKPKPKHNVLFVLCNGVPDEWAIARNVPVDKQDPHVWVAKLEGVPDDLAAELDDGVSPKHMWDELVESCQVTYLA